jgi:hypothetical protein
MEIMTDGNKLQTLVYSSFEQFSLHVHSTHKLQSVEYERLLDIIIINPRCLFHHEWQIRYTEWKAAERRGNQFIFYCSCKGSKLQE